MELIFTCPKCREQRRRSDAEAATVIGCDGCGYAGLLPVDWAVAGRVHRCPICGVEELFRQKDFNQKIGILVLVGGAALAVFTKYLSLLAAALLDLVLYVTSPEVLVCYSCRAHIRGHRPDDRHGRFDPRVEEEVRSRRRSANPQNSQRELS